MGGVVRIVVMLFCAASVLPSIKCEKTTYMGLYVQGVVVGDAKETATEILVAQDLSGNKHSNMFTGLVVFDDMVAEDKELSKEIARSQGLYSFVGSREPASMSYAAVNFNNGSQFPNSSLYVLGLAMPLRKDFEYAIVGGTNVFRSARGSIFVQNLYFNTTNGNSLLFYNVTVTH